MWSASNNEMILGGYEDETAVRSDLVSVSDSISHRIVHAMLPQQLCTYHVRRYIMGYKYMLLCCWLLLAMLLMADDERSTEVEEPSPMNDAMVKVLLGCTRSVPQDDVSS